MAILLENKTRTRCDCRRGSIRTPTSGYLVWPQHSLPRRPRTPIKTPFAISIIAADEILLVTLRFYAGADRDAIEACMFQIAETFAVLEGLSEKELQDLFWEQKRLSLTEHCITLRRGFSDPDFPQKFDAAFRRLTGDLDSVRFH
jgi:hypothetical protein